MKIYNAVVLLFNWSPPSILNSISSRKPRYNMVKKSSYTSEREFAVVVEGLVYTTLLLFLILAESN